MIFRKHLLNRIYDYGKDKTIVLKPFVKYSFRFFYYYGLNTVKYIDLR